MEIYVKYGDMVCKLINYQEGRPLTTIQSSKQGLLRVRTSELKLVTKKEDISRY